MNIQNWGIGKIMELPDWCFGRRFMVSCTVFVPEAGDCWDISEVALPEMCVIWELAITGSGEWNKWCFLRVALGDEVPRFVADMDRLEPLFMGLGEQGAEPRRMRIETRVNLDVSQLRMPVASQGKRMVIEGRTEELISAGVQVVIVVSGVPKEIPDWLVSGNLRSR